MKTEETRKRDELGTSMDVPGILRPGISILALLLVVVGTIGWAGVKAFGQQHDRDDPGQIELIAELMGLEPGAVGADIGAGGGRYTVRLAPKVAPGGHFYANEIDGDDIPKIRERVERAGLEHVTVVQGSATDTGLPENCCDALMLRYVYHHLTDPPAMQQAFLRNLKPGGRLLIVEGDPEDGPNARGVPENRSGMGIDRKIVIDELTSAGFTLEREVDDFPNADYALLFRAPGS